MYACVYVCTYVYVYLLSWSHVLFVVGVENVYKKISALNVRYSFPLG